MSNALDIALAAPRNAANLAGCLSALEAQWRQAADTAHAARWVVAHAGPVPTAWAQQCPHARWLACDAHATLPDLWGRAIAETCGETIAILDADCAVADGWLPRALDLVGQSRDLVGGAVEPRDLHSRAAWAAYFVDYGAFLQPLPQGTPRELAGNNLLIRRALLNDPRVREFVVPKFWKAHLLNVLRDQGVVGESAPQLVVTYEKNYTARAWMAKRFRHARCYAAMRLARASWRLRAALIMLAPLVPLVLFARIMRNVLPRRRYVCELILSSPWVIGGLVAWACGEWIGCVFGAGNSCNEII